MHEIGHVVYLDGNATNAPAQVMTHVEACEALFKPATHLCHNVPHEGGFF